MLTLDPPGVVRMLNQHAQPQCTLRGRQGESWVRRSGWPGPPTMGPARSAHLLDLLLAGLALGAAGGGLLNLVLARRRHCVLDREGGAAA